MRDSPDDAGFVHRQGLTYALFLPISSAAQVAA
jgi:hypothetical protein